VVAVSLKKKKTQEQLQQEFEELREGTFLNPGSR